MKSVGIKALKNELSHYLRLVREGELIFITDRDEIIAELRQPSTAYASSVSKFDSFMAEITNKGEGSKAKVMSSIEEILKDQPKWKDCSAMDALNKTREDR